MRVLFVAAEAAPYVKVGGLADVVGALPRELSQLGVDVRLVLPLYGSIQRQGGSWKACDKPLWVKVGSHDHGTRVWEHRPEDSSAIFYFLEYQDYFARHEVYDGPWGPHHDNDRRFIYLSRAAIDLCHWLDWTPEVIHCHDWSSALTPVYLNTTERHHQLGATATVLTIHNLQHQGYVHRDLLQWARLPDYLLTPDNLESMGALNLLKGGLYHATKITTVSPTYAAEIQGWPGGCGLEDLLRFRAADLIGLLNGIDTAWWNPATDRFIAHNFSIAEMAGKTACKADLQSVLGLAVRPEVPLFGVVSRLYDQKGLDLLPPIVHRLFEQHDLQIALLGTGERWLEEAFRQYFRQYPGRFGGTIGFGELLAHKIYAGADFFLMPSRFEPCGLGQMYAMTYGTIPVARATGGLRDTIISLLEDTVQANGLLFQNPDSESFYYAMAMAEKIYREQPDNYRRMQKNGMMRDFSWRKSARQYLDVYRWAVEQRRGLSATAG